MKRLIAACILAVLVAFYGGITLGYNTKKETGDVLSASKQENPSVVISLFNEVNTERENHKLNDLVLDSRLNRSAKDKCTDMALKNYWAHNTPDGTEPWQFMFKYSQPKDAGENLARGMDKSSSIVTSWMNSPEHKKNILDKRFTNVGYAVCRYKTGEPLVVQHFASY